MENNSFENICYEFQTKLINIFNEEQQIPFLLKYYLLKEIWENVETGKLRLDAEFRKNNVEKTQQNEIGQE